MEYIHLLYEPRNELNIVYNLPWYKKIFVKPHYCGFIFMHLEQKIEH